jgi:hypothetical protein
MYLFTTRLWICPAADKRERLWTLFAAIFLEAIFAFRRMCMLTFEIGRRRQMTTVATDLLEQGTNRGLPERPAA